jgi:uncharacterized membrane protein YphA (DoxX/SURF4 family)
MQISRSKTPVIARLALGTLFLVFGLNGFFHFIPQPAQPPPPEALAFAGALLQTGYMFPLVKGTEVFAAALLLSGRYVPFALTLLAPIVVNIVAFHVFLAPGAVPLTIAFTALGLGLYLAWTERVAFKPLFQTGVSDAITPPTWVRSTAP